MPDYEPETPEEKQEGFPFAPSNRSVEPEEMPRVKGRRRRRVSAIHLQTFPSPLPESEQLVRFSRAAHILLMGYRRWQAKQTQDTPGENDDA